MKIITKKKEKLILKEECWNLDYSLIVWLNNHLKQYYEDADKMVDLDHIKFKYKRKEYTQREIIERLIAITNVLIDEDTYWGYEGDPKLVLKLKDEMYDLLKISHFSLWW